MHAVRWCYACEPDFGGRACALLGAGRRNRPENHRISLCISLPSSVFLFCWQAWLLSLLLLHSSLTTTAASLSWGRRSQLQWAHGPSPTTPAVHCCSSWMVYCRRCGAADALSKFRDLFFALSDLAGRIFAVRLGLRCGVDGARLDRVCGSTTPSAGALRVCVVRAARTTCAVHLR